MRNIYPETIPRLFLKSQNWAYFWVNSESFMQSVFIVCHVKDYRNILKLSCRPPAFTSNKAFLKNKKRSGTSLPAIFFALFLKRKMSLFMNFYLTKLSGCLYFVRYWAMSG